MKGNSWKRQCDRGSYVHPKTCHGGTQLYSFFNFFARWEWVVNPRPGRSTPGKDTQYPLDMRLGGALGSVLTGAENLVPTRIRSPDRPARSKSLFRLRYPGLVPKYVYNI